MGDGVGGVAEAGVSTNNSLGFSGRVGGSFSRGKRSRGRRKRKNTAAAECYMRFADGSASGLLTTAAPRHDARRARKKEKKITKDYLYTYLYIYTY